MPNTLLNLHSAQRKVRIPDRPDGYGLRGRLSGKVPGGEVTWTPGRLRWNAIPDTYELRIEIPEFKRSKAKFTVGKKASDQKILIPSRCTKLPTYGQLETWQRLLLRTIGRAKKGSQIWARLSDNQRATFFQVTYALGKYQLKNGTMLSEYIRRVVRLGGSEMIGTHPKKPNKKVTVVGWRIHVDFFAKHWNNLEQDLSESGFKKDAGKAHPTHSRFGYVKSFRQRKGSPKLQVTLRKDNSAADIDLDAGVFHRSAPHDVYKRLAKTFKAVKKVYKVV